MKTTQIHLLAVFALLCMFLGGRAFGINYNVGDTISLQALPIPDGHDYQWSKDGLALSDTGRIRGAQTPTLTISAAACEDTGTYILTTLTTILQTNRTTTSETLVLTNGAPAECVQTNLITTSTFDYRTNSLTQTVQTSSPPPEGCSSTNFLFRSESNYIALVDVPHTIDIIRVFVLSKPAITHFFTVTEGDSVQFRVEAEGCRPLFYQWFWQGRPILGATTNVLTFTNAFFTAPAGFYSVVVFNQGGLQDSSPPPGLLFTKSMPSGTYQGLFFNENPEAVTVDSSGSFQMSLRGSKGTFSGKLVFNNFTAPFSGSFSQDQSSRVEVAGLVLDLQLVATNDTAQVIGTVSSDQWTSSLKAHRVFYSSRNPFPQAGQFTLSMWDTNLVSSQPNGASYAALTVSSGGSVNMAGRVADGTAFSQTRGLSKTADLPLCARLYRGQGLLIGWLQLTNLNDSGIQGDSIVWTKPAGIGPLYPDGFTNVMTTRGSTYVGPVGVQVLPFIDGVAAFTGGDLFAGEVNVWDFVRMSLSTSNFAYRKPILAYSTSGGSIERVHLDINPRNGVISGRYTDLTAGFLTLDHGPIGGVVLQQQGVAQGYFLTPDSSGYFTLEPVQ